MRSVLLTVLSLIILGICSPVETQAAIAAPVLVSPANGATNIALSVTLIWKKATGATGYDYEVYTGSTLVTSGGSGGATNVTVNLSENTTYTWRVRGKTSAQTGTWSGLSSFTTKPPIPAPNLISPGNGSTGVSLVPTLQWQNLVDATAYDYEVYAGASLAASGSTSSLQADVTLAENTTYTWRARGKTSTRTGTWSGFWSFTTKPPLAAPILISPADNAEGTGLGVSLNWQQVADATAYDYEILQNNSVVQSGSSQPPAAITLAAHGVYQWHVRAKTSQRTGPWSGTFTFSTHPPIAAPVLVSPANGAIKVALLTDLQWNNAANATAYDYEVYQGATLVISGSTNGLAVPVTLAENTTYNWHVRGKTSQRTGTWSATWSFTTKPPLAAPVLVSPANGATSQPLQPTLQWQDVADTTAFDYEILLGSTVIESGSTSDLRIDVVTVLAENTTYNWHVRGKTSQRTGPWSTSWTFTTKPPLSAPILISPADNAEGTGLGVSLNWQTVADATGYDYEILQNNSVVQSGSSQPPVAITLAAHGVYQWHVKAKTSLRSSPWSATFTFSTHPPIAAPVLISPGNGAANVTLLVDLLWNNAANATAYDYEVYQGATLVISGSTNSLDVPVTLAENTTYNWRARGKTSQRIGSWSDTWSFTTKPPLTAPALTSPANNAQGTGLSFSLNWQSVPESTGYEYQILQNGNLIQSGNGQPPRPITLTAHGVYQWRVRAYTSQRSSPWSDTFTFATHDAITAPSLVSPANGANEVPLAATIAWGAADNATAYDYEVYNGATPIANGATSSSVRQASLSLAENTTYSWHVRGKTSQRTGPWSDTWNFATRPPLLPPILISPGNNTEGNGLNLTLSWSLIADATAYDYEILQNGLVIASGSGQPPVLNVLLPAHGIYQWHARGKTSQRTGPWSDTWSFCTRQLMFTTQPVSLTISPGVTAMFSAVAQGMDPLRYQWLLNGVPIVSATNSTYSIPNALPPDGGKFSVMVFDPISVVTSTGAVLKVNSPALVFADNFAARGSLTGFSGVGSGNNAAATREAGEPNHASLIGSNSLWIQWTAPADGLASFNTRGSSFDTLLAVYTGSNFANLTEAASDDDSGGFLTSLVNFVAQAGTTYLIAIDGLGGENGDLVFSWNLQTSGVITPVILRQPRDTSATPGGTANFNVLAYAQTNFAYQWYFGFQPIAGATNSTLIISPVADTNGGAYHVEVSSGAGLTVSSRTAALEIGSGPPSVDKPIALLALTEGGTYPSVSVGSLGSRLINAINSVDNLTPASTTVNGTARWYKLTATTNGTLVVSTTGSTVKNSLSIWVGTDIFNFHRIATDDSGTQSGRQSIIRIQATAGTAYYPEVDTINNDQGNIIINWEFGIPPTSNSPNASVSLNNSSSLTLQAGAGNPSPAPSYQWRLNGVDIPSATFSTLPISNPGADQVGTYSVVVSGLVGVVTNIVATVMVETPLRMKAQSISLPPILWVSGSSTQKTVLQFSEDLFNWTPVYTNLNPASSFGYSDSAAASHANGFYRLVKWQ